MAVPKRYKALHILPGLVNYTEKDQETTVRVTKEALEKMNPSFLGKPVFNFIHKAIDPETAFNFTDEEREKQAVGVITDVGYDEQSGYFWVLMMIWDEETQLNIDEKGYTVSCAYIPEVGPGGTHNKVPYDEEVTGGEYHHMAIVENPRYEGVRIFENSEGEGTMAKRKFKLFTSKKAAIRQNADQEPEDPKENMGEEEEMEISADAYVVDDEGNKIPVAEMVENYKAMKNAEGEDEEEAVMNMEDTIDIDGEEVSMKDLYENYCAKKNAEPPTDTPLEESVKENGMKENSDDDPKKPNKHFKMLANAASRGGEPEKVKVDTPRNRIARGAARYGSKVKQEA